MQEATPSGSEPTLDFDPLTERFFSQPPPAWEVLHDDWQPEPMSSLERVAMLTTAAPAMAFFAVGISLLFSQPVFVASPAEHPAAQLASPAVEAEVPNTPPPQRLVSPPQPAPQVAPAVAQPAPVAGAQPEPVAAVRAVQHRAPRKASTGSSVLKRARQALDAGRADAARELAQDAVRSAPDRAAGYIVLAAALDKLGDRAGKSATLRACSQLATDKLAPACAALRR